MRRFLTSPTVRLIGAFPNTAPLPSRARFASVGFCTARPAKLSYFPTSDEDFELDMADETKAGETRGGPAKEMAARGKKKQSTLAKTPKGTSDWLGADSDLREEICNAILEVLRRSGGTTLDTPTFELTEILRNKLGEDQKLIYDLADQYDSHT